MRSRSLPAQRGDELRRGFHTDAVAQCREEVAAPAFARLPSATACRTCCAEARCGPNSTSPASRQDTVHLKVDTTEAWRALLGAGVQQLGEFPEHLGRTGRMNEKR